MSTCTSMALEVPRSPRHGWAAELGQKRRVAALTRTCSTLLALVRPAGGLGGRAHGLLPWGSRPLRVGGSGRPREHAAAWPHRDPHGRSAPCPGSHTRRPLRGRWPRQETCSSAEEPRRRPREGKPLTLTQGCSRACTAENLWSTSTRSIMVMSSCGKQHSVPPGQRFRSKPGCSGADLALVPKRSAS